MRQYGAEARQCRPHVAARHHHIDHAVVFQKFGALETFGQPLADRLLDHPRSGKADDGTGFGNLDIAEHGIGGGDPTSGWIGQHDDIGQASCPQPLHGDRGARHLHQREHAFLHARPARGREQDERRPALHGGQHAGDQRLARRHA